MTVPTNNSRSLKKIVHSNKNNGKNTKSIYSNNNHNISSDDKSNKTRVRNKKQENNLRLSSDINTSTKIIIWKNYTNTYRYLKIQK